MKRSPFSLGLLILPCLCSLGGPQAARAADHDERPRLAVLPLVAKRVSKEMVGVLDELLTAELDRTHKYRVISAADLNAMLTLNKMQDALGCDNVACAAEIGAALGVELLLSGSVSRLGGEVLVSLALLDTRQQQVANRGEGDVPDQEERYAEAVRSAVAQVCGLPAPAASPPKASLSPPSQPAPPPAQEAPPPVGRRTPVRTRSVQDLERERVGAALNMEEQELANWYSSYEESEERRRGEGFAQYVDESLKSLEKIGPVVGLVGAAATPLIYFGVRSLRTPSGMHPTAGNVAMLVGGGLGFVVLLSGAIVTVQSWVRLGRLESSTPSVSLEGVSPVLGLHGGLGMALAFSF
jgi:TolB-like protein